jgi:hypothetical protein
MLNFKSPVTIFNIPFSCHTDLIIGLVPDKEYARKENSNIVEVNYASDGRKWITRGYFPFIPNIRDGEGHLIMPHEYEKNMIHGDIVIVNVKPTMWVSTFMTVFILFQV